MNEVKIDIDNMIKEAQSLCVSDPVEASRLWRVIAEQGYPIGQSCLGFNLTKGYGVEQNYPEGVKWLTSAAMQGNSDAFFELASMYLEHEAYRLTFWDVLKHFIKLAEEGNVEAQETLYFFYTRYDVWKDFSKALKWLRLAAENGSGMAQMELADIYEEGDMRYCIEQDYKEAAKWYREALLNEYKGAAYKLANLTEQGLGIKTTLKTVTDLYLIAALQGNEYSFPAYCKLVLLSAKDTDKTDSDIENAIDALRIAADSGYKGAMISLAKLHRDGVGVAQNDDEAIRLFQEAEQTTELIYKSCIKPEEETFAWWQRLADLGYDWAQYNMGRAFEDGIIVEKDMKKATDYYERAISQNYQKARDRLAWRFSGDATEDNPIPLFNILRGMIYEAQENIKWPEDLFNELNDRDKEFRLSIQTHTVRSIFAALRKMAAEDLLILAYNRHDADGSYFSRKEIPEDAGVYYTTCYCLLSLDSCNCDDMADMYGRHMPCIHVFYTLPVDEQGQYDSGRCEYCTLYFDEIEAVASRGKKKLSERYTFQVTLQNTDKDGNVLILFKKSFDMMEPFMFLKTLYLDVEGKIITEDIYDDLWADE